MPQGICVAVTTAMSCSKPSKSARKREFQALQSLGEELIGLSAEQLANVPLEEALLDAVNSAKRMKSHGALRRQKQFIGKLMRQVDPEPIRVALDALGHGDRLAKQLFRETERWRDRITAEGPAGLDDFFALTGSDNRELREHSIAYEAATDDKARRLIRRRIFKEVHGELATRMQEAPG